MIELVDTFANRLNTAMRIRNMKPVELSEKTGIDKSKISSYMSGRYKAKQDGVYLLAQALSVNEAWLMGCDVPMEKETSNTDFRYANHNGINTEGLDDNDIEEINRFVEFIRNKKKNEGK